LGQGIFFRAAGEGDVAGKDDEVRLEAIVTDTFGDIAQKRFKNNVFVISTRLAKV